MSKQPSRIFRKSSRAVAEATLVAAIYTLAACGSDNNGPAPQTLSGAVTSSLFDKTNAGNASGDPVIKPGYYSGATVFLDVNGDGKLSNGEPSTATDANGKFKLTLRANGNGRFPSGQIVADVSTTATNTADGSKVSSHLILRASADQIADQGASAIVISPRSSEVQSLVEANGSNYQAEKANLAQRLSVPFNSGNAVSVSGADALADVNTLSGTEQAAVLFEDNALTNRYTYATLKLDRGDQYPDNLAVAGGDPTLVGLAGVTQATAVTPLQTQAPITFAQSQQAALNVEGVPRYDNIFIIMMENKSTDAILGNARAPNINGILSTYNQFTTYYSTGNPSEPNYTALGGGDDAGITDDNWFGCGSNANPIQDTAFAGGTASDGAPVVATAALPPQDNTHLAGFGCSFTPNSTGNANHNVPGDSLFTQLSKAGLSWRTYSESMNPGQDLRGDSVADAAVADTYNENGITGTANYAVPNGLYKVKHNPAMAYQTARLLPEFFADNRTAAGTQYTAADWAKSTVYPIPAGYNYDQLGTDLANGDVGNVNFVMPDQCDDMHGVGSDSSCAGDNSGQSNIINRGDFYVGLLVQKIKGSPLWSNPQRHVAIVVMFDEGEGSSTSCCGWNAGGKNSGASPLVQNADGTWAQETQPAGYANGNGGHGNSIFAVITNQQDVGTAAKGVKDSDAYSHFSLVRTVEDMFQLSDPATPATYVNRAKYTEAFIAQNITALPEFAGSADTHFDSVRPMNHAYVIPATYVQRLNPADITGVGVGGVAVTPQTGPDANQDNIWAVK